VPNNRLQRTALRATAEPERWKYHRKFVLDENHDIDSLSTIFKLDKFS